MKVAFSFFRKPLLYDCDFKDIKHLTLTRADNQLYSFSYIQTFLHHSQMTEFRT